MNNNHTRNNDKKPADPALYALEHGVANAPSEMIGVIRECADLYETLLQQEHAEKARRLGLIVDHEILRLASLTPMTASEAHRKATFLTEQLAARSLSLNPMALSIIEATLAFEADLFRAHPSTH